MRRLLTCRLVAFNGRGACALTRCKNHCGTCGTGPYHLSGIAGPCRAPSGRRAVFEDARPLDPEVHDLSKFRLRNFLLARGMVLCLG